MILLEEIRLHFAAVQNGIRKIESLDELYPGWSVRMPEGYGVAVPYINQENISEHFANAKICNRTFIMSDGKEQNMLMLICTLESLKYEFATFCAQFINPGEKGNIRNEIVRDPLGWWERWRMLLGNAMSTKNVYSVLAELIVMAYLMQKGEVVEWVGVHSGTHDIESNRESYEVKSTIKKYESTITISSQNQLKSDKPLSLYFCRLEKSRLGQSINGIKEQLINLGYSNDKLELQLEKAGFEQGTSLRNEKYRVIEKRKYIIDKKFPKITNESFINGKLPDSIVHIVYTIDLEGLEYIEWS